MGNKQDKRYKRETYRAGNVKLVWVATLVNLQLESPNSSGTAEPTQPVELALVTGAALQVDCLRLILQRPRFLFLSLSSLSCSRCLD